MYKQSRLISLLFFVFLIVACQPNQKETQVTVANEIALAVSSTKLAQPKATAYATASTYPTQNPLNTATAHPTQQPLATTIDYPTATTYPTFTPLPTFTPTPIPPTAPPAVVNSASDTKFDPYQTHIYLLEQMTLQHNLLSEFQGLAGTLNQQESPDCNRIIELYNGIKNLPEMNVSGTDENVQQAYSAYRSAIDHFTKPETVPGDLVKLCQEHPEDVTNMGQEQLNIVLLYTGESIRLIHVAWYDIGGK